MSAERGLAVTCAILVLGLALSFVYTAKVEARLKAHSHPLTSETTVTVITLWPDGTEALPPYPVTLREFRDAGGTEGREAHSLLRDLHALSDNPTAGIPAWAHRWVDK